MPRGVYVRQPGLRRNVPARPLADRFWAKVEKSDGCWLWKGFRSRDGYGRLNLGRRGAGTDLAHRVSLALAGVTIPTGMSVDHLCRNPACVRPDHLEVVTLATNTLRNHSPFQILHRQQKCRRGHDSATEANRRADGRYVYCRACRREDRAAQRAGASAAGN